MTNQTYFVDPSAAAAAYVFFFSNLLLVHVLVVALLHHLSLPALLFQGLLDELGHLALFPWLLSADKKPASGTSVKSKHRPEFISTRAVICSR